MQFNSTISSFTQHSNPYEREKNPIFAETYEFIVNLIQEEKTNKEKMEIILKEFDQAIKIFALKEQCIEELKKKNKILVEANDKAMIKYAEFTKKMRGLANQIESLLKIKGIISRENDQLKKDLEELIKDKETLWKGQDFVKKQNVLLKKQTKDLLNEQQECINKHEQLKVQLEEIEKTIGNLSEKNKSCLAEQEKLKIDYHNIQKKNEELNSQLEEIEFQKKKEKQFNCLDRLGYLATGLWFTIGVLTSKGSSIQGLVTGGMMLGVYQIGKYYINNKMEKELKEYAKKHPTASTKEIWENVMSHAKREK